MKLPWAVLVAASLHAQTAMFQPVSLAVSNSALGGGRDLGVWVVSVELPPGTNRTRTQILMAAPGVRAIPNRAAVVLLTRKAYGDPKSTLARVGGVAMQLAPLGLSAAGILTSTPGYQWAGFGASAFSPLLAGLKTRAPDLSLFSASDLLPDVVTVSGQWYVVASLAPHAEPIGPVRIP